MPRKMTAKSLLFRCQITGGGGVVCVELKILNHIPLIPLAVTEPILVHIESATVGVKKKQGKNTGCPFLVALQVYQEHFLLLSLFYGE